MLDLGLMMRMPAAGAFRAPPMAASPDPWRAIIQLADLLGSTELVRADEEVPGEVWIARLCQARYWSPSQARLLARRVIWSHLDVLFGGRYESQAS
jgi:hypothetical protein